MGCLGCVDKMFTKDKNAGLGMMNDVAHVCTTYCFVALGKLLNLSNPQSVCRIVLNLGACYMV